jgi:pyrimidine deaminase RibD-like protein
MPFASIESLRDAIQELLFFSRNLHSAEAAESASTALQTIKAADIAPPGHPKETWLHQFKVDAFKLYCHITTGQLPPDELQNLLMTMKARQDELWAMSSAPGNDTSEQQSVADAFMQMAINEARKCKGEDGRAHPKVGAVVVRDGIVLAAAHRGELGKGDHAEYTALEKKLREETVAGATVFTTLEPCTTRNHPKIPCANRLVERRVKRVVIGMLDPNPEICGKGIRLLREHNIEIELFPAGLMAVLEELNREFTRAHLEAVPKAGFLVKARHGKETIYH